MGNKPSSAESAKRASATLFEDKMCFTYGSFVELRHRYLEYVDVRLTQDFGDFKRDQVFPFVVYDRQFKVAVVMEADRSGICFFTYRWGPTFPKVFECLVRMTTSVELAFFSIDEKRNRTQMQQLTFLQDYFLLIDKDAAALLEQPAQSDAPASAPPAYELSAAVSEASDHSTNGNAGTVVRVPVLG